MPPRRAPARKPRDRSPSPEPPSKAKKAAPVKGRAPTGMGGLGRTALPSAYMGAANMSDDEDSSSSSESDQEPVPRPKRSRGRPYRRPPETGSSSSEPESDEDSSSGSDDEGVPFRSLGKRKQPTSKLVAAKRAALPASDDDEEEGGASLSSQLPTSVRLPKAKRNWGNMKAAAAARKFEFTGSFQGGKFPEPEKYHAHMPDDLEYAGYRERQVLHHFSEVMRWHLERNELSPVEVQAMYLRRGSNTGLGVSANDPASQAFMAKMTDGDMAKMFAAAEKSGDEEVQRAALKMLNIEAQNQSRRGRPKTSKWEKEADLKRAEQLAGLLRKSSNFGVIGNRGKRHAEQNLEEAFKETFGVESEDQRDVAGTLIRCGACSAVLGHDSTLQAMMKRQGLDEAPVGKAYPGQLDKEHVKPFVDNIASGAIKVEMRRSRRARSTSPAVRRDEEEVSD